MQVVLLQRILGTGQVGEVVTVSDGYARNYLLPHKLAAVATPALIATQRAHQQSVAKQTATHATERAALVAALGTTTIRLKERAQDGHLFGSVNAASVLAALRAQGLKVPSGLIKLATPLKTTGAHRLPIHAEGTTAELTIIIEPV